MPPELCVVIPTLNEAGNVRPLYERIRIALEGIAWEAIYVDDDSSDGTREELLALAQADPRVRFLHRVNRRGLSSACVEGMLASTAPYLIVMDADLQHDETLIPEMFRNLAEDRCDIVLGSRFADGSSCDGLSAGREQLSRLGIRLANLVLKVRLTDPLTGFFGITRKLLLEVVDSLSLKGFKIVVDIFASSTGSLRYRELPMRFRERASGTSKLNTAIYAEFLFIVADKLLGRIVPVRFLLFVLVGCSGVLLHLSVLGLLYRWGAVPFVLAQTVATYVAMVSNYCVNNLLTYYDQRLRGWAFLSGLLGFCLVCSIGAFVNLLVADFLFSKNVPWFLAGLLGAVVGAVWNYGVSSTLVWHRIGRRRS